MLVFVDVEATGPAPCVGEMTEFAAVCIKQHDGKWITGPEFYAEGDDQETAESFENFLGALPSRPIFVSDNPAFDWQWINDMFWKRGIANPFGHSARRIGDYWAGLHKDFRNTQKWKRLRRTKHDHNPLHDARGNAEAFVAMEACKATYS